MRPLKSIAILTFAVAAVALTVWLLRPAESEPDRRQVGLMTSLPIYWDHSEDFGELLADEGAAHWVKSALERQFEPKLLDNLAAADAAVPGEQLKGLELLILAQPSALPPADLAALDIWVRGGGKLLLFADPMLTEHSSLALGDKRRPQAIAMMSPILDHWGLRQLYDEAQPKGVRLVAVAGSSLPVDQAGFFERLAGRTAQCELQGEAIIAECAVGSGKAVIVADAALLDGEAGGEVNLEALNMLLLRAFGSK